ncbi:MAG: hypothetical protein ACM3S4_00325 [Burkholderiales bacterium]
MADKEIWLDMTSMINNNMEKRTYLIKNTNELALMLETESRSLLYDKELIHFGKYRKADILYHYKKIKESIDTLHLDNTKVNKDIIINWLILFIENGFYLLEELGDIWHEDRITNKIRRVMSAYDHRIRDWRENCVNLHCQIE